MKGAKSIIPTAALSFSGTGDLWCETEARGLGIMDSGCSKSIITQAAVNKAGLDTEEAEVATRVIGVGGAQHCKRVANVTIKAKKTGYTITAQMVVVPTLGKLPPHKLTAEQLGFKKNELADDFPRQGQQIDFLIGQDLLWDLYLDNFRRVPTQPALVAHESRFGWVISGLVGSKAQLGLAQRVAPAGPRPEWEMQHPQHKSKLARKQGSVLACVALEDEADAAELWESLALKCTCTDEDKVNFEHKFDKFMSLEDLGIKLGERDSHLTYMEQCANEEFERSVSYDSEKGRYKVGLLWSPNRRELLNNKNAVIRQFLSMEQKLDAKPELKQQYIEEMEKSIADGALVECEGEGKPGEVFYLPQQCVVREDKSSTKLRVCVNASSKGKNGVSLNDNLLAGPSETQDLLKILIGFRGKKVAYIGDIRRMYSQIQMNEDCQDYLRIVYRRKKTDPLKVLKFTCVVFGAKDAPSASQKVLNKHADKYRERYPLAHEAVTEKRYVDDITSANDTDGEAIETIKNVREMMATGGFHVRKWLSNSKAVNESIPVEDRLIGDKKAVLGGEEVDTKALGVKWDAEEDTLGLAFEYEKYRTEKVTKRIISGQVSSTFDPLGCVQPYLVTGKRLMTQAWKDDKEKVDAAKKAGKTGNELDRLRRRLWDEEVSKEISEEYQQWQGQIESLKQLKFPRCVVPTNDTIVERKLCIFSDASPWAFAACAYMRSKTASGKYVSRFIAAKSKVGSEASTMPRMELCGLVLSIRLFNAIKDSVEFNGNPVFFTDSSCCLMWAKNPGGLRTFAYNRVKEILETASYSQLRHVPGVMNPADEATRGRTAEETIDSKLWWEGPEFLTKPEEEWPHRSFTFAESDAAAAKAEMKGHSSAAPESEEKIQDGVALFVQQMALVAQEKPFTNPWFKVLDGYNDYHKMLRTAAYFLFKRKGKSLVMPTTNMLRTAMLRLVSEHQHRHFEKECASLKQHGQVSKKSDLLQVNPILVEEAGVKLIRAQGRFPADGETKAPPLVLKLKTSFTDAAIMSIHLSNAHAAVETTLFFFRQNFWCGRARRTVRECIQKCIPCRKFKAKPCEQAMAPLPLFRLEETPRPWTYVAVDAAGPFVTYKKDSNEVDKKVWLLLWTCLQIRALEIEVLTDLKTDSVIHSLRRVIARHGDISYVQSDNAASFRRARQEIEALNKAVGAESASSAIKRLNIEWNFSAAAAPWQNAAVERLVRTTKEALRGALQKRCVTYEEFVTLSAEACSLCNSRPLGQVPTEAGEVMPCSPSMLLLGYNVRNSTLPFDMVVKKRDERTLKAKWADRLALRAAFMRRFQTLYLSELHKRRKWHKPTEPLKEGELVLVVEPTKRVLWPLARVKKLVLGRDNLPRSAILKTPTGEIRRPVQKLIKLDSIEEEE